MYIDQQKCYTTTHVCFKNTWISVHRIFTSVCMRPSDLPSQAAAGSPVGEEQAEAEAADAEQDGPPPRDPAIAGSASSPAHGCRCAVSCASPQQLVSRPGLSSSPPRSNPWGETELDVEGRRDRGREGGALGSWAFSVSVAAAAAHLAFHVGEGSVDATRSRATDGR